MRCRKLIIDSTSFRPASMYVSTAKIFRSRSLLVGRTCIALQPIGTLVPLLERAQFTLPPTQGEIRRSGRGTLQHLPNAHKASSLKTRKRSRIGQCLMENVLNRQLSNSQAWDRDWRLVAKRSAHALTHALVDCSVDRPIERIAYNRRHDRTAAAS